MPIVEKSGLMKYKDADGNTTIMYPITNTDNVDGLEEWNKAMLLKNTQVMLPASEYWKSVCYGNDKFVAVASGTAAYSTNGTTTWARATIPTNGNGGWTSVCYGNGKFVGITSDGNNIAAYSTDGINWTQTTLPASAYWTSVCYGNDKFVAVALFNGIAAYSTDGINWTQTTFPTNNGGWDSVCYGNGKFVAVSGGGGNIAAYSTDGINWTETTLPASAYWTSVCYGSVTFVAMTNGSTAAYSYDGINWTNIGNDLKVFDPDGTNVTANLNKALGAVTMAEVNAAIQSAIQNTWEASY